MAEVGVLAGSAGAPAGVPDAVGFMPALGGICAPDPVGSPEPDADADGAFGELPVLSRWKNSTSAAITATTGMMRKRGLRVMASPKCRFATVSARDGPRFAAPGCGPPPEGREPPRRPETP